MHACGHDAHTAILMSVAEVLAGMKAQLPGTVKFIFQPSEEGAPPGEEGGAALMIKEGVLENPKVDAIFGLHAFPYAAGSIYCITLGICRSVADYRRAAEWTEAVARWCDREAITGFPGVCRVQRAEILRMRGRSALRFRQ